MDNAGSERKMTAREMTAEIERATTPEEVNLAGNAASRPVVTPEMQRDLGRIATGERQGLEVTASGEMAASPEMMRSPEMMTTPEQELRQVETELTHPDEFVGQESQLQMQQYLAEDAEDLQNELGQGLKFVDRIVAHNQEEVAAKVAPEVEKLLRQKSFHPSEIVSMHNHATDKALGIFGRRIGERNNAA